VDLSPTIVDVVFRVEILPHNMWFYGSGYYHHSNVIRPFIPLVSPWKTEYYPSTDIIVKCYTNNGLSKTLGVLIIIQTLAIVVKPAYTQYMGFYKFIQKCWLR